MGDLSQAQVVGGAIVTVGVDMRGLTAGEAEAKAANTRIGAMTAKMAVAAVADKNSATAAAAAIAAALPKTYDINVAVKAPDIAGVKRQLEDLKATAAKVSGEYGISGSGFIPKPKPVLNPPAPATYDLGPSLSPQAYALAARGYSTPQGGPAGADARAVDPYDIGPSLRPQGRSYQSTPYALKGDNPLGPALGPINNPQSDGGRSNYQGSGIGPQQQSAVGALTGKLADFGKVSESAGKALVGLTKIAAVVEGVLGVASAGIAAFKAIGENDPSKRQKLIEQGQNAIAAVPVLGGTINRTGSAIYSAFSGAKNLITTGRLETDYGAAERIGGDAAEQDTKTLKASAKLDAQKDFRSVTSGNQSQLAISKLDEQDKEVGGLLEQRRQLVERLAKAGVADTPGAKAALDSTDALIAESKRRAGIDRNYQDATASNDLVSTYNGAASSRVRGRGETDRAGRMDISEGTRSQVDQLEAERSRLAALGTDKSKQYQLADKIKAIKQAGSDALAAYDEELERNRTEVITASKASARQTRLRGSGNVAQADEEAIAENFRPRIETARRNNDSATADALADEQQAQIDERRRQRAVATGQAIDAAEAQTSASRLRLQGEGQKAEIVVFDAGLKARLESLRQGGADQKQIDAEAESGRLAHAEIVERQRRDDKEFDRQMDTRRAQAAARGEGMNELAGTLGTISQMRTERENPNLRADQKDALKKTQSAELVSMANQVYSPNRYAEELDRNRTAIGGPNGTGGKEDIALLQAIRDELKTLNTNSSTKKKLGA
jgi:hypothetical protein